MFSQRSVGLTVLGGMLAVLLVGLAYVPAFFVVVQRMRERFKKPQASA